MDVQWPYHNDWKIEFWALYLNLINHSSYAPAGFVIKPDHGASARGLAVSRRHQAASPSPIICGNGTSGTGIGNAALGVEMGTGLEGAACQGCRPRVGGWETPVPVGKAPNCKTDKKDPGNSSLSVSRSRPLWCVRRNNRYPDLVNFNRVGESCID